MCSCPLQCGYWCSEAEATSVVDQSATRCSLAVFPFLDVVFPSSLWESQPWGRGQGGGTYLWQTLCEYESLQVLMTFPFVICFHGHCWVSGWEKALHTWGILISLLNNLHRLPVSCGINVVVGEALCTLA